jgi:hypothetical protein
MLLKKNKIMLVLVAISITLLLVNAGSSYADKSDAEDKAKKAVDDTVEKAEKVVSKATSNGGNGNDKDDDKGKNKDDENDNNTNDNGKDEQNENDETSENDDDVENDTNDNSKGNDDKDEVNDDENDSKENDNDDKDKTVNNDNNSEEKDVSKNDDDDKKVNYYAKSDDETDSKSSAKEDRSDRKSPIIKEIMRTDTSTCVKVNDNSGVKAVKSGSISLALRPGSYDWYCTEYYIDSIIVTDTAGNKLANEFEQHNTGTAQNVVAHTSFLRFKNMASSFEKDKFLEKKTDEHPNPSAYAEDVDNGQTKMESKAFMRLKNMSSKFQKEMF